MTKKLEELLNLPSIDSTPEESLAIFEENKELLKEVDNAIDKIDAALPGVRDLDTADSELDELAQLAKSKAEDLIDLGMNVDDRNAGAIFDVASKMMSNAITAKNSKLDAKLRRIELQLKAAKLQLEKDKHQSGKGGNDGQIVEGEGYLVTDRNALLDSLTKKIKNEGQN